MHVYTDNSGTTPGDNGVIVIGHSHIITYYETCPNVPDDLEEPIIPAPKTTYERAPVQLKPYRRPVDVRGRAKQFTQARVRR